MSTEVRLAERRIWVGEESRALLSGEVHYWRLHPRSWRDVLEAVRRLGLDLISAYVPWEFHELAGGRFDFDGASDDRRGLTQFLKLAQETGFWVIIRPGPYIYAEWNNQGVPDRVAHLHRLHPDFQREAARWIKAVSEALRPFLATNGGPVVICQLDNEIDPSPAWHGSQLDPAVSQHEYVRHYLGCCAADFRQAGIDVPLSANTRPDMAVQPRAELLESVDLIGSDHYPSDRFAAEPEEHRRFLERLRYLRTASELPYVAELGAGMWHGQHYHAGVPGPDHYRHVAASAIIAGLAGWNWYMLVNRDNWYGSPINEWGRERGELTDAFRGTIDLFRELDVPALEKVTNTALLWPPDEAVAQAVYAAGIDYELFDPNLGRIEKPLLLAGPTDVAGRTREYVERGGTLVIFEGAKPAWGVRVAFQLGGVELLADGFPQDAGEGEPITGRRVAPRYAEMAEYDRLLAVEAGREVVVGRRQRIGTGTVLRLGIDPTPEAILAAHAEAGVAIPARAAPHGAQAALFQRPDGRRVAIVVPDGRQPSAAILHLQDGRQLPVDLSRRPYAVIHL